MNNLKYKGILYFIAAVILATLYIQVYWNYRNYETGKQQLINDVQTSLDNAVDGYYTDLAKNRPFNLWKDSVNVEMKHRFAQGSTIYDTISKDKKLNIRVKNVPSKVSLIRTEDVDSLGFSFTISDSFTTSEERNILRYIDSVSNPIESLSSKIFVSFVEDTLSLNRIDSLVRLELARKNINIDYGMSYEGIMGLTEMIRPDAIERSKLETQSRSPFVFHDNIIRIHFSNITFTILKKNLLGILLSFLLLGAVIACLLYLLGIINKQKQLAEVKNDLINNITHEFKTPIATIGVAMEAIRDFNESGDVKKNQRYAKISQEQVDKLNNMVEKLLETATLDSEKLALNFEVVDLVDLLRRASNKDGISQSPYHIVFNSSEEEIPYSVDVFHFENAINNIIDNAIKYGGDEISVGIERRKEGVRIAISDNGNSLSEAHKKQIFEKFYRVPKGNTHDVKGFGIGLYYTKKIIEKHQGTITLHLDRLTTFEINLPHA